MTYTAVTIIYNPHSTGSSETMAKEFAKKLRTRLPKQKVELIATTHAGHAEELAYSLAKASKNPIIISSSGDGGYNELVNGAMRAQKEGCTVTTGLLPAGNANDHYHNLHERDLIDLIVKNESREIDLLKIKSTSSGRTIERYAHSYIGIGLTPQVGKELNKSKLNFLNEVWVVARGLFAAKSVRLKIKDKVRYYESVVCSNVDTMSKYLKISQPSSVTDGKFEVTIFRRRNKLQLILVLLHASIVGAQEDSQVSEFALETIDSTLVQVDGEIVTLHAHEQAVITIEKGVLRCVV